MNYHKLNIRALYNYLFDNGFWIREKRLLINDKHNCWVCLKITSNENILTWVEPRNASIEDICNATTYIENIKEQLNNV